MSHEGAYNFFFLEVSKQESHIKINGAVNGCKVS